MSVVAWIILGLISGFIGSKIVNKRGEGIALDIVLGISGEDPSSSETAASIRARATARAAQEREV